MNKQANIAAVSLKPLILDYAVEISPVYSASGVQQSFPITSKGTHNEPDSAGLDP